MLTLAREIRSLDATVPVIVTTAFEQTDYLLRAIEIDVDKFVAKPIDPGRLHQALLECAHRLRIEVEKVELEAQTRQLQKAESLGLMAGAIAHHFNNQLQAVMGNLEMAMDFQLQREDLNEVLDEAMKAACRASEMGGLMLTYLGQTSAKREAHDLSDICRKSLPMLNAALPSAVFLEADLSSPGPVILANENQIRQVMTNLVSNALEAIGTAGSTIRLVVRSVASADIPETPIFPIDWLPQHPAYACLEISDSGCGIPHQDIEKIFDPFFTSKFTGRGLGLAVVQGLVRAHGGAISVESEPGRGSVFRVYLPISA
jgi:signal transduction histidine kinase